MAESRKNSTLHPYPAVPLQVIWVGGSEREIGRQHAEQLTDSLRVGMAPFYYEFFRRILNPHPVPPWEKWGFQMLSAFVDRFLIKKLVSQIPEGLRQRIQGVSEVSGIPEEAFLTTLILPDLLPMLQAHWVRLKPELGIAVNRPPLMGCSSFVVKSEQFLHGRNLDFPGVSYWDRYPVLQVTRPQKGHQYIGITSAGVPLAGISGINECGISVALHQHYCTETDWTGQLPFVISEKILREAEGLEQALQILKQSRLASSWAFVVADGKARDGFIYEATPKRCGVRWLSDENNVLVHTNYFQSEACRNKDYATTERMNWDNFWRKTTLERNLRSQLDNLTALQGARALSCHVDGFWNEEKIVNRTVSQVYNIQSYVLDPVAMKAVLAVGDAPIHLGHFHEIDLKGLFRQRQDPVTQPFEAYRFKNEALRRGKQEYILSFVAAFNHDFELALKGLQESLSHVFTPEAALVAALVNLKCGGDIRQSQDWVLQGCSEIENKTHTQKKSVFPPEYFELKMYLARTYELQGHRSQALSIYRDMLNASSFTDQHLRGIAERAKPYTTKNLRRLIMPYSSYIPFD